ncbi:MAG: hypothetical protein UR45_C0007G0002 [candidate division WS6 bacterium GW2011_WS6_33_547]|nr:MAG: hypothetical protein UR45_C0007G0002 [candidate division WS6 bacterium GW2011_WS6_33_547]
MVALAAALWVWVLEGIFTAPVAFVPVALGTPDVTVVVLCVCVVAVLVPPYVEFPLGRSVSRAENLVKLADTVDVNSAIVYCFSTRSLFEQKIISKYGGNTEVLSSVTRVKL